MDGPDSRNAGDYPFLVVMLEPRFGFWAKNLRVSPAGRLARSDIMD
jgi:hypothetical protein